MSKEWSRLTEKKTTNDADKAQAGFTKFHSSIVLQKLTRFINFDKLNDQLDKFYFEDILLKGFPEF